MEGEVQEGSQEGTDEGGELSPTANTERLGLT